MGTPGFAVPVLSALVAAGHEVVGVFCQPDRRASRGRRVTAPPVKVYAAERGLPVFQPSSLRRDEDARRRIASIAPEVIVVAAYGLLLPTETLAVPRLGCLNVHPSLLPLYRGPSPVSSAILAGESGHRGHGDEGGRGGGQRPRRGGPTDAHRPRRDDGGADGAACFSRGRTCWWGCCRSGPPDACRRRPRTNSQATLTRRLSRSDGALDWTRSADYLARQVRAYHPWPGSATRWRERRLKVVEAQRADSAGPAEASPGEVVAVEGGVGVGTGDGVLELRRVQMESRGVTTAEELARGHRDFVGSTLG